MAITLKSVFIMGLFSSQRADVDGGELETGHIDGEASGEPYSDHPGHAATSLDGESVSSDEDVFHDCLEEHIVENDVLHGGLECVDEKDDECVHEKDDECLDRDVTKYVNGKCVFGDGTASPVSSGEVEFSVPRSYVDISRGDERKAERMWEATKKWRIEENVWDIHSRPHHMFHEIKDSYSHVIHGVTKEGYPVIYEQPGKMKLKTLFRTGCSVSDVVRHYIFFMEYISNCICKDPELRTRHHPELPPVSSDFGFVVVMDMTGVAVSLLSADVLRYMHQADKVNSAHYPMSMKQVFAVNVTGLIAMAWGGVKKLVPTTSKKPPEIFSKDYVAGLQEYIDLDQIPPEFGGSSPYPLGQHPFELRLWDLVFRANAPTATEEESIVSDEADPVATTTFEDPIGDESSDPDVTVNNGIHHEQPDPLNSASSQRQHAGDDHGTNEKEGFVVTDSRTESTLSASSDEASSWSDNSIATDDRVAEKEEKQPPNRVDEFLSELLFEA